MQIAFFFTIHTKFTPEKLSGALIYSIKLVEAAGFEPSSKSFLIFM